MYGRFRVWTNRNRSRNLRLYRLRLQLTFGEQVSLVLPDLVRAEFVRRPMKVAGELLDCSNIEEYCLRRIISTLEFFQHHLA